MKRLAACLLLAAAPAAAAERKPSSPPPADSWHGTKMEAAAILGEIKFQHGDLPGADNTFKESLDSSTKLDAPQASVMGLDLFRTAQLALRRGDAAMARRNLEILVNRYPDSEWAEQGQRLLALLPKRGEAGPAEEDGAPPLPGQSLSESLLRRLRAALAAGRDSQALAAAEDFLARDPADPRGDEVRVLAGALRLKAKEPAAAARALAPVAAKSPDASLRAKAAYLLAAATLELGRLPDVLKMVPAPAPDRPPDLWGARARVWRAAALARLGRRAEAARLYQDFLACGVDSPLRSYALAALSEASDREDKPREAAESLVRTVQEARRWGQGELAAFGQLALGHSLYRQASLEPAVKAYSDFIEAYPDDPQLTVALYQKGLALRRLGRREEARRAFEGLLRLNGDSVFAPDTHLQLGQLYAEAGSGDKAIAHYQKLSPQEAQLLTAQVHYNAKRYAQAIPLYKKYLETAPKDNRSREVEGLLLNSYWLGASDDPGMFEAAARYPAHAVAADIRLRQAEGLAKRGDLAGAAAVWQAFLKDHDRDARARLAAFRLGAALGSLGQHRASAEAYARVSGSDDLAADAAFNRALALDKAGGRAAFAAACESFVARFPRHPHAGWAWFVVGQAREDAGRLELAVAAYRLADASKRLAAMFRVGRCLERLKKPGEAALAYESLRDLKPESDPARVQGLLRLALLSELRDPVKAMGLYGEVMRRSGRSSPAFETARKRLAALTSDGSLLPRK